MYLDFNNQELKIGDYVVGYLGGRYSEIIVGKIDSFTPKMVKVEVLRSSRWRYESSSGKKDIQLFNTDSLVKLEHPYWLENKQEVVNENG